MSRTVFILIFLFALTAVGGEKMSGKTPPQSLTRGDSITLSTAYPIGDVAVTDPKVLDFFVKDGRNSVFLNARSEGTTTLTLWDDKGTVQDVIPVTVYGASVSGIIEEGKRTFRSIRTIEFLAQDDLIRIVGQAPSPAEHRRIQRFADRYEQVRNEVTLAAPAAGTLVAEIERGIAMPGIKVRLVRDRVVVEGVAFSAEQANKAFEIAKLYAPDALNLIEVVEKNRRVGREEMIELDLYFMEVQRSALRSFGVQWAPGSFPQETSAGNMGVGGGGSGDGAFSGIGKNMIGFVLNLLPKIKFLREKGLGRVLENPKILVKSGDVGKFFSGVEIPYYSQQNVQFKQVGIEVEAEPILSGGEIDLKLNATLSTPSPHINGGINKHNVDTTAWLKDGEAVVLAGLVSHRDVKTYNRVPKDLATGSALFTLFLSKDFQSSKTELIVFALPRAVTRAASAESEQKEFKKIEEQMVRDRSMKEYKEYMKSLRGGRKSAKAPPMEQKP